MTALDGLVQVSWMDGRLGMARRRSLLLVQVLLFLLVTLLGVATSSVTKTPGVLPWGLEIFRRESLPLAGITVLLIIGVEVSTGRRSAS
jgi:hypothetical protein